MRILLTSNASYLPPRGGSTRSNLAFLETLIARGHQCRIVSGSPEMATPEQSRRVRGELEEQKLDVSVADRLEKEDLVQARLGEIEIVSVRNLLRSVQMLANQIAAWRPDWVMVSSEDLSHTLLRQTTRSAPGRLVYLAHTPQWYPFGPAAWNPNAEDTATVRQAAAVIAIGQTMAAYIERYLGRKPLVVHPPMYGKGPWPVLGRFDGAIGMVNPCAVKGIGTFLALADQLPDRKFSALPGWGTTTDDLNALKRRKNITISPRVKDIDQFLRTLSVLLMPSVWLEGFGLIVMEAMLRGVPVIASDAGGLKEAKRGTAFTIPGQTVLKFAQSFDERNMPRPMMSTPDIEPWVIALYELTKSQEAYDAEARREREQATQFVQSVDPGRLEKLLLSLPAARELPVGKIKPILSQLSDAKRDLLLKRLRERSTEKK